MWTPFLLENAHFAINLFAALSTFAVFWLYFDAWKGKKKFKEGLRVYGFFILSLSFVLNSVFLETAILEASLIPKDINSWGHLLLQIGGYGMILASVVLEKLEPKPITKANQTDFAFLPFVFTPLLLLQFAPPILALCISVFYIRRATVGLEAHIRPVAFAFAGFSLYEFLSLTQNLLQTTQNIQLYTFVLPLGPLWIFNHLVLLLSAFILGRWVFAYLLKQFQTQLFIILSVLILTIFLVTTTAFTYLLLRNIEDATLTQLEADAKVFEFALTSKEEENTTSAQMVAQNPEIIRAIRDEDKTTLGEVSEQVLLSKESSFLVITDDSGQILARGEDKEKIGDSLSNDVLVKRALRGEPMSTISSKEGVLAPEISLAGAAPIFDEDKKTILGVVILGTKIDNAFVDGVKKATGLEASLYGDARLSATTLTGSDGKTRLTGIEEKNTKIKRVVLTDSQIFTGETKLGSTPYVSSYLPLKDLDDNPVGMLFVGRPQITVLHAAGRSIELTFIAGVLMIIASIIPSHLISKYLAKQLS